MEVLIVTRKAVGYAPHSNTVWVNGENRLDEATQREIIEFIRKKAKGYLR